MTSTAPHTERRYNHTDKEGIVRALEGALGPHNNTDAKTVIDALFHIGANQRRGRNSVMLPFLSPDGYQRIPDASGRPRYDIHGTETTTAVPLESLNEDQMYFVSPQEQRLTVEAFESIIYDEHRHDGAHFIYDSMLHHTQAKFEFGEDVTRNVNLSCLDDAARDPALDGLDVGLGKDAAARAAHEFDVPVIYFNKKWLILFEKKEDGVHAHYAPLPQPVTYRQARAPSSYRPRTSDSQMALLGAQAGFDPLTIAA